MLHSCANPAHERRVAEILAAALPELPITLSSEVCPEIREYERLSTACANAYVQPMMAGYLTRLQSGLRDRGFDCPLLLVMSSGGVTTVETAIAKPIRLVESGPAGGAILARDVAVENNLARVLSFDMGGTTAKGALVRGGAPLKRYEMEVARVHDFKMGSGLPAKIPVIDLIEIGAGGGSIAAINARGTIQVGPKSAGADPGPVCYGLGGSDPTLTDANLTLGYLDADFFLGGEMPLDATAVGEALAMGVGRPLQVSEERAAWGIHESVNEDISRAFRNHASERGFDYRACVMVAFGGSGPAHACRVARKLRVPTVIFPPAAGVMSAVGLLSTPLSFETFRSGRVELSSLTPEAFEARFAPLIDEALSLLKLGDAATGDVTVTRRLDMRYRGQGYELEVPLPDLPAREVLRALPDLYTGVYEQVFAKSFPAEPLEIINWKVEASVPLAGLSGTPRLDAANGGNALKGKRKAYEPVSGRFVDTPVYDRYALGAGDRLEGPALIEERESTGLIGAGDSARVDGHGNLVVTIAGTA
ncbi:MAG: hydantoinase/oxoprolinase family protein [Proteobacteria bacterium]|nr:hydantoinase/oxoprolinase family protein [Pseudomonadota bacterium]